MGGGGGEEGCGGIWGGIPSQTEREGEGMVVTMGVEGGGRDDGDVDGDDDDWG